MGLTPHARLCKKNQSSMTHELQQRLDFAVSAARRAGELILKFYQSPELTVDLKRDRSPVTAADRGAEELLRAEIENAYPADGILGEEFGEKPSENGYRWILDPVDGTKPFVHGVPLFGTLIGLEHGADVVVGVCHITALDEMIYAGKGLGTWWQIGKHQPRRAKVSDVSNLADAVLCFTEIAGWHAIGRYDAFEKLCKSVRHIRGWGDCYGHILVATGRADAMIDPLMNSWDAAPLKPIMEEAGGHFVNWNGETSIHGGNGISVNAALKDVVLAALKR